MAQEQTDGKSHTIVVAQEQTDGKSHIIVVAQEQIDTEWKYLIATHSEAFSNKIRHSKK